MLWHRLQIVYELYKLWDGLSFKFHSFYFLGIGLFWSPSVRLPNGLSNPGGGNERPVR